MIYHINKLPPLKNGVFKVSASCGQSHACEGGCKKPFNSNRVVDNKERSLLVGLTTLNICLQGSK